MRFHCIFHGDYLNPLAAKFRHEVIELFQGALLNVYFFLFYLEIIIFCRLCIVPERNRFDHQHGISCLHG